jgi:hypothetical protein
MIISRIDREALYDAQLAIDGLSFPGDIAALCFQLGEALKIITVPTVADVIPAVAQLEAALDGLRQARQKLESATFDLHTAWSGEAADTAQFSVDETADALQALSIAISEHVSAGAADLRQVTEQAAETVETARLRMMRAFSLTPQLRCPFADQTARYAALFALIKTEARQGIYAVVVAYADFDQASLRFIDHAERAGRVIRPERRARTGGFLA